MALTKQELKTIIESKTGKKFEDWKAEQLKEFMLMLMEKNTKDYKVWEDRFVESKVLDLVIEDAKSPIRKNPGHNEGGN